MRAVLKKMKRIICLILSLIMCFSAFVFASCEKNKKDDGTFDIVAAVYPYYDFLKHITDGAKNVNLSLLLSGNADMHSYQPDADDIISLTDADFTVYTGGVSDVWVADALKKTDKPSLRVTDVVFALKEETVEGMHTEHEGELDEHEEELDEHVWLSLKNASLICSAARDMLCSLDPENADIYRVNTEKYIKLLNTLDGQYKEEISHAAGRTLIFAGRFPFRYLVEDYNLEYYAAFPGCSAETDASFATVAFLSQKVKELNVPCVAVIDGDSDSVAKSIVENSGTEAKIVRLNSMQTGENSEGYIETMTDNLKVIIEALG